MKPPAPQTIPTAPDKSELELMKQCSHDVWAKYSDEYGYRTQKQEANARVTTLEPDNVWFFWNQFDSSNQTELVRRMFQVDEPRARRVVRYIMHQNRITRGITNE